MEHPARMARQPGAYPRMLVDGIVVHDRVYDLAGRDCCLDGVEKADEFLMTVALHAATEHRAVEHVQGRKQRGRAMPLVVMRHGRGGKRGKTPGSSPNGGVRTRKEVSVFKRIPEAPIPEA